jgi:hypothetical protein
MPLLLQMAPRLAMNDSPDVISRGAERLAGFTHRHATFAPRPDCAHLFSSQYRHRISLADGAAPFGGHVCRVFSASAQPQMIGPYARTHVALVEHAAVIGHGTMRQFPGKAMGLGALPVGVEPAVPAAPNASEPQPTGAKVWAHNRAILVDLRPEPAASQCLAFTCDVACPAAELATSTALRGTNDHRHATSNTQRTTSDALRLIGAGTATVPPLVPPDGVSSYQERALAQRAVLLNVTARLGSLLLHSNLQCWVPGRRSCQGRGGTLLPRIVPVSQVRRPC